MAQYAADPRVLNYGAAARSYGSRAPISQGTSVADQANVSRLTLRQRLGILIAGADAPRIFFGPQQPLPPIAQPPDMEAIGRQWDYPVGFNTRTTPRDGQEIGFGVLKALAGPGGYDVLRGMIERVKDNLIGKPWSVMPRDKEKRKDARCQAMEEFFRFPDKQHSWQDWTRQLLEQVLVLDAPAVWLRPDRAGRLYSLDLVDGATITPKIMPDGRLPPPEVGPAYQQVLKGIGAVDYIQPVPLGMPVPTDPNGWPIPELLYKPRNPRVDSPYGFGPVEQMVTTINIALSREAYLQQYYTMGSTPDTIFTCPPTWTTQDIANFKVWWDSVLEGNLGNRRGSMFVPDGTKPFDTKEKALTDTTDEWLVRIMCFFLGLSPMPFIKMMNRATAQTHQEQGSEEGQAPWQRWLSDFFETIMRLKFGYNDLVFRWEEEESTDAATQATIDVQLVTAKIYHPDEIRAKRGDEPMSDDLRSEMDLATFSATPNATVLPDDQQQAQNDHALAMQAAKPAPVMAPPGKGAAKFAKLLAALKQEPSHITVEAPVVNVAAPAITVEQPAITVNTPDIKMGDTFIDAPTSVHVKAEPKSEVPLERHIEYSKVNGEFVGRIVETRTTEVRKS